jgi:hypothetical protein
VPRGRHRLIGQQRAVSFHSANCANQFTRWPFVPDSASAKQCQQGFGSGAPKAERIWRRMSLPDAIRPNAPSHAFC